MNTYNSKPWETRNQDSHAGYGSGSKGGAGESYHKSDSKYGAGAGEPGSEYMRGKEAEEKQKDPLFDNIEEEKKEEKIKDDEIPFRAAKQVFNQNIEEQKKEHDKKKKSLNSIEEAIKKAVEDEKKVIVMD